MSLRIRNKKYDIVIQICIWYDTSIGLKWEERKNDGKYGACFDNICMSRTKAEDSKWKSAEESKSRIENPE